MRKLIVLAALFILALTGSAFGQTADEVILLAQKGVGEDVLMAFVEASTVPVALSVADIVKLKDANVPDKVVVAMLRRHPVASVGVRPRAFQEAQPEYPVRRDYSQAQVEYQPAVQQVVEVPSTTYVYDSYPYAYDSSYYGPGYYSYYYPYYYPSVSLGFVGGRSFHRANFLHSYTGGSSNFHSGFHSGSGFGGSGHHGSVSVGGGGYHASSGYQASGGYHASGGGSHASSGGFHGRR